MFLEFLQASLLFVAIVAGIIGGGIGIVRAIDYIEDNPYAAKEKIQMIVHGTMGMHALFLFMGLPIWHILFSFSIQYALHSLFVLYPAIRPEDPRFIYGILGSLVNHFLFIKFFVDENKNILLIILSFIIIWVTPFCFFFSMSASDDNLFVKKNDGKGNKTYAGILVDWLMTVGRKRTAAKNN